MGAEIDDRFSGQPAPDHVAGGESMHDVAVRAIEARRDFGLAKYGTPLQANNGRDALVDALEEILDAAAYLCQAVIERDGKLPWEATS
jgi:hypothetical protein